MKTRGFQGAWTLLLCLLLNSAMAQSSPFSIHIEPMTISGLPGIQSYSHAQSGGKWLIVGGRLDGLHRAMGMGMMGAPFPASSNNNNLVVVDPVSSQFWTASLGSLPVDMQEQLSATNAQFYQEGDYLYVLGGYGYSSTAGEHKTFDKLSAIHVPGVMQAVIAGNPIAPHIRQLADPDFQVTGGQLEKIGTTYYLVGGHNFDGTYHHMSGMGMFTQTYTNAIRKFTLSDNGTTITVGHLAGIVDSANLHRRDYNLVPQVMPGGHEGITAFSGVFQVAADLPYLNSVDIDSSGHAPNNAFSQYYNHYQCAFLPVYCAQAAEMHTVFFGGMAQYYDVSGVLTQDDNVPFVNTIARVTRHGNGSMDETKLPATLPSLLGAGSALLLAPGLPTYPNHVVNLDLLTADTTLVGYVYGGISSPNPNVFMSMMGGNGTTATNQIFKVYLVQGTATGMDRPNAQSTGSLQMQLGPNPGNGKVIVHFSLNTGGPVRIDLLDESGKLIGEGDILELEAGRHSHQLNLGDRLVAGAYLVRVSTAEEVATQRIVIMR